MTHRMREQGVVLLSMLFLAGCAFPGWQLDGADGREWHVGPDDAPGTGAGTLEYEPVYHAITPALVAREATRRDTHVRDAPVDSVEAARNGPYRVGKGDLLSVIVFGHPDLTNPAGTTESVESSGRLVDAEGQIFMPFIGEIEVEGETVDQIRTRIAKGLAPVINNPQVDVRVIRFRSQSVVILGDVARPCRVPIEDIALTLVEALDRCQSLVAPGGSGAGAPDVNAVQLVRGGQVERIVLSERYRTGAGPVVLQNGDRIIIDDQVNRVFVVGEFAEQRAVPFSAGGMNLADAISAGGGIALASADPGGIYVIRGFVDEASSVDHGVRTALRPHIYHLDASSVDALLLADQFPLQARDVVYAAPASLVNFNRALGQLTPSLDVLLRSAILFSR